MICGDGGFLGKGFQIKNGVVFNERMGWIAGFW